MAAKFCDEHMKELRAALTLRGLNACISPTTVEFDRRSQLRRDNGGVDTAQSFDALFSAGCNLVLRTLQVSVFPPDDVDPVCPICLTKRALVFHASVCKDAECVAWLDRALDRVSMWIDEVADEQLMVAQSFGLGPKVC